MNQDDKRFLVSLGGEVRRGSSWKILMRNGRALLIMPAKASSINDGARLYSPQRTFAKVFTSIALSRPCWRMLSAFDWDVDPGSPIGCLMRETALSIGAILLGNPSMEGRRALILTEAPDPKVLKIGVGVKASDLVSREKEFLAVRRDQFNEIPEVIVDAGGHDWEALGVSYFDRGRDAELSEILSILPEWLENKERPFEELPGWKLIRDSKYAEARDIERACSALSLRPSLVHGDLAKWNVRRKRDGEIVFIDWENGRCHDVPCWDAVHFVFQQAALVDRLPGDIVREKVMEAMGSKEFADLIDASGWGGNEDLLFASYLAAMATEGRYVSALLPEWSSGRVRA